MFVNKKLWFILITFLASIPSFAVRNIKYKFETITIEDGLSQSKINKVVQDEKQFIWIATQDGLNKYNSYEFKIYKNKIDQLNSLSSNYCFDVLTIDSELWVATDKGLNMIDLKKGKIMSFFFDPLNENSLANNLTRKLLLDNDSNLWVGASNGKLTIYNRESKTFTRLNKLPITSEITDLKNDSKGNIWIGTAANGILIVNKQGQLIRTLNTLELINSAGVKSITINNTLKHVWVGSNTGLSIFNLPEQISSDSIINIYKKESYSNEEISVNTILHDSKNKFWLGTNGHGLIRVVLNPKTELPESYHLSVSNSAERFSLTSNVIYTLFEDISGVIWVGTSNGVSKFSPSKQYFDHIKGFTDNSNNSNVWSLHEDKKGTVWIGTREGLSQFNKVNNKSITTSDLSSSPNFKSNNSVYSILEDSDETLWAGTIDQLLKIERNENNEVIKVVEMFHWGSKENEYIENPIYRISEAKNKDIYFGTRYGIGVYKKSSKEFEFIRDVFNKDGSKLPSFSQVRCIEEDKNGNLWVGTERGLYKIIDKDFYNVTYFGNEITGFNNIITSLLIDGDFMWVGTYGGGLIKFSQKTDQVKRYSERNGLSNNVVYGILKDHKNNLWMSTNKGLCMFNPSKQTFTTYTEEDGLQSNEFNAGAYTKGRNNYMIFGGINGFNIFNPRNIIINTVPPVPVISDVKLYNRSINYNPILSPTDVAYNSELNFKHKQNNLTIEFAGLQYLSSSKNSYQYKLDGFDEKWVHTTNRQAIYNNLEPGNYTFLLKACNSDGLCNESPLKMNINIKPAIFQQWWFRVALLLALIGLALLAIKTRFKLVENQKKALAILVQRRTKEVILQKEKIEQQKAELEEQKQKSDELLRNMLPLQTAKELQLSGKAKPRSFKMATVMFTDFKNFTRIAEKLNPKELVEQLDKYFKKFDDIIEKYNLEKIKTIGDSYMCVGGIPIRNRTNPYDVVLAALEIQHYMDELKLEKIKNGEQYWEARVGVHTGSLVAGVIGSKRFAYDIWGDTVNIANRLETTCLPGKVNISGVTYRHIKDYFECTHRGKIQAKNKGEIEMYFVDRIKPEYSRNKNGKIANNLLITKIDELIFGHILNYKKAEKNLLTKLRTQLPSNLYYHNVHHTIDICAAAEKIAIAEGLKREDVILIKTAALYHDAGFIEQYHNNEHIGIKMAKEDLPKSGFSEMQIEEITNLIDATSMPSKPQTHFQKILCDADLDYLGRDDFFKISDKLKREFLERSIVKNDLEWDALQIKFISQHQYFTETSQSTRDWKKYQNLTLVKKRYQTLLENENN